MLIFHPSTSLHSKQFSYNRQFKIRLCKSRNP
eukprot:UN07460